MKINDLVMNQQSVFRDIQCNMSIRQRIISKDGRIEMIGDNQFKFINKDCVIDFRIVDENEAKLIMDYFNRHFYCLANVTVCSDKDEFGVFFLHMSFFYNLQRMGNVPVIFSDEMKKEISSKYTNGRDNIDKILEDNFTLSDGIIKYFAYTKGKYYFGDDNKQISDTETDETEDYAEDYDKEFEEAKRRNKQKKDSFVIYGRDFCVYTTIKGEGLDEKLYVEKVGGKQRNIPIMMLAEGSLNFSNYKSFLSQKVKDALESTKGYLDLWNQYAEKEGEILLEKARRVGLINLKRDAITIDKEGLHVPYTGLSKDAQDLIANDSFLFFSDEVPVYLAGSDMTWQDYRIYSKELRDKSNNHGVQVKVVTKKNGGFILKPQDGVLPDMNYVSLSILGDEKQINRREDARTRIAEGTAANPALGLLLEGQLTEEVGMYASRKKIPPLSSFVKDKIFAHEPTETQKRAIDIALNTPDIAIIQGPPGTGKTTVITAIIERLNEICNKQEKINGQVLITSFQHDAVRNVIERLRINSLPTIKFGKQDRGAEEDLTREKLVEEWCEDYIEKLSERNPELAETEQRNELSKLHNIYLAYPSDSNAIALLECAKKINIEVELDKKINELIELKSFRHSDGNSELLTLIRRIRVTKEGFMDDGAENADLLLEYLERSGLNKNISENKKVYETLDDAAAMGYNEEPEEELLNSLKDVKSYLLQKCIPKPFYRKDVPDTAVTNIYRIVNQSAEKHKDEKSAILADLLKELRSNRSEVEKSLQHYLFVYSATTQQSEGNEIKTAKGIKFYEHPEYETVIVDEAARVSPADLMIPLSQANRRIILVGDHRQLPHIYDEEIFESMKENGEDVDINNIQKSMFEYMLEKAKELEKKDNIQRTIILDAQYRMHPVLGKFVNDVFYEPHNEHFSSPLPAKNYSQLISKKEFPIEWYDLPDECGNERKEGTSRVRDCEADFIVDKIHEYMSSEEGKNLSYGVITFYSGQVKNIKRKLRSKLKEDAEKVRVGSVDAFQGMEFDVIFLSVVRSNRNDPVVRSGKNELPKEIDFDLLETDINRINKESSEYKEWQRYKEKAGLQNYGFLISENRLCVSLSRQKKLLIVVGNSNMFRGEKWGRLAGICVPGMKQLYDLCEKEEVVYNGHA